MFNPIRMGASAAGAYEIENSLRFHDGDSTYLRKNDYSSPDSGTTFTFSAWVKLATLDQNFVMFGSQTGTAAFNMFAIDGNNRLIWRIRNSSSSDLTRLSSTARFRDTSSWYHFVLQRDSTQGTAGDRAKLYANGVRITEFDDSNNDNEDLTYSSDYLTDLQIGRGNTNGSNMFYADGYMAEIYYIDGQALPASNFGEFDTDTGQWIPKKYGGTYGSNGIYLNFSDNSDTTSGTLGADSSGNGNNFTPNNFSVAAGEGNDSLEDTPTNNCCTLNPLKGYGTTYGSLSNGNLDASLGSTSHMAFSSIAIPPSGKWYAECKFTDVETGRAGIKLATDTSKWNGVWYLQQGEIRVDTSVEQSSLATISDNDIVGIAVDRDANTIQFYKNGSTVGSTESISATGDYHFGQQRNGSSGSNPKGSWNFGQRAFGNLPSGFQALTTNNLPEPTIKNGTDYFNSVLYTGNNNTSQNITGVGFQPDLVWVKNRDNVERHHWVDSVRGNNKMLHSEDGYAERTGSHGNGHTQLNLASDGFNLVSNGSNDELNFGSRTYVAWNWKESATAGFDIVSYTGDGNSPRNVAHNLGVAPDVVIVKRRSDTEDWIVGCGPVLGSGEEGHYLKLNSAGFPATGNGPFNSTNPTSSNIVLGSDASTNGDGSTYIAYCFSNVEGYSKAGKYTGNGNSNGIFIYTGFKPSYFLVKRLDTGGGQDWEVRDTTRNTYNPVSTRLIPNETYAESALAAKDIDFVSNGFKIRTNSTGVNSSGVDYFYLAFAERPFKYSNAE